MSNYVTVDVVCPCGKLLMTKRNNADSNSVTSGSKRCTSCNREVRYEIRGANAKKKKKN